MLIEGTFFSLAYLAALSLCSIVPSGNEDTNGHQASLLVDSKPSLLSEGTLLACLKAPNCETYEGKSGTMIRFVAGEEPGTVNYRKRFGTQNASIPGSTTDGGPSAKPGSHSAIDGDLHTNIDIGQKAFLYGSTKPYDAIHFIWDHCDSSSCNPEPFTVDTSSVRGTGSNGNSVVSGYTLSLTVSGQYDGWPQREVFIEALLAASSQGQETANERWKYRDSSGDVETGTLVVYSQTGYISVNRFDSHGGLHGLMSVQVTMDSLISSTWCSSHAAIAGAIAGAVDPVAGGFFGFVSAACAGNGD